MNIDKINLNFIIILKLIVVFVIIDKIFYKRFALINETILILFLFLINIKLFFVNIIDIVVNNLIIIFNLINDLITIINILRLS